MKYNSSDSTPTLVLNEADTLLKKVFTQDFQLIATLSPQGLLVGLNDFSTPVQVENSTSHLGKELWHMSPWCHSQEWQNIWQQRLQRALEYTGPNIAQDTFSLNKGSLHHAEIAVSAIYEQSSNKLLNFIVAISDCTTHRLQQAHFNTNETRLEIALKQSTVGHWELNLVDFTSFRSLTHDRIFGYDNMLPEWTYDMFLEHVVPKHRPMINKRVSAAIENKTDWSIECQIMRQDGQIRWILASGGHAVGLGNDTHLMVGIVLDITDLKQAKLNKSLHSAELKSLFNALPDTYFRLTSEGVILDYHAQNVEDLYTTPEQFLNKRVQDVLPQSLTSIFQSKLEKMNQSKGVVAFKYTLMIEGKKTYFEARLNKIQHNNQVVCVIRNVTSEQEAQASIVASEQFFRTIFEQASIGVALVNFENKTIIKINQRLCNMLGYSMGELSTVQNFEDITHPDDLQKDLAYRAEVLAGTRTEGSIEKRYIHKNGHVVWVTLSISVIKSESSSPKTLIVVAQDISERKKAEDKLLLSSKVFSETQEGIMITDADQKIIDINPAFEHITGYSREDVLGKTPKVLKSGHQNPDFYKQMWQSIHGQGHWQGEIWNHSKQGSLYAELLNISSLTDEQNRVTHYIGMFSDITSIKQQQEKLNLMAHYDELTKLPNRVLFIDRFNQSIAHSIRSGNQLAICFLDLDDFKPVNDNYGHDIGDRLLVEVAQRIKTCLRDEDTVSRQGGDEFAILLNDIKSTSQYETTVDRILQTLSQPYYIDNIQHRITASSGVTLYPLDDGDIDTLLRHADHAMYQSKLAGKNQYHLYSSDSDKLIIKKHLQLDEIKKALKKQEFQLYFQPKVNMASGVVVGVEALLRWFHPIKGMLLPLTFLPSVDGTTVEISMGEWVINEALQQLEAWQSQGISITVSVNISSNHILSPSFYTMLKQSLAAHPAVNSKDVQLEILESSTLGDLGAITKVIKACQNDLGVSFALDDFGTGYSSLTHLRRLPVNTIKIDQSFISDMLDDPGDYSIIEGVIALSQSFNLNVIAEGVETSNHGLLLLLMECEQAQGFFISEALPAHDFVAWLDQYKPKQEWLDFAKQQYNEQDRALAVFKLVLAQWKNKFVLKVLSDPNSSNDWPILDKQLCHCGSWIYWSKLEGLVNKQVMQYIETSHNIFHAFAKSIYQQYELGDIVAARADLAEFERKFDAIGRAIPA